VTATADCFQTLIRIASYLNVDDSSALELVHRTFDQVQKLASRKPALDERLKIEPPAEEVGRVATAPTPAPGPRLVK
jgi:hypothetical protein